VNFAAVRIEAGGNNGRAMRRTNPCQDNPTHIPLASGGVLR